MVSYVGDSEIWCPVWETGRFGVLYGRPGYGVLYGRPGDLVSRIGDREIWCPVWETRRFDLYAGDWYNLEKMA